MGRAAFMRVPVSEANDLNYLLNAFYFAESSLIFLSLYISLFSCITSAPCLTNEDKTELVISGVSLNLFLMLLSNVVFLAGLFFLYDTR